MGATALSPKYCKLSAKAFKFQLLSSNNGIDNLITQHIDNHFIDELKIPLIWKEYSGLSIETRK